MLEVEKNFDLVPGDKERLIKKAEFIEEKTITDTYYDSADYKLTCRDYWLRKRDGKFELKVPLNKANIHNRLTDQYKELETVENIAEELNIKLRTTLELAIIEAGYIPFVTIKTHRTSYRWGDFKMDFDEMDFSFATMEVELMVQKPEDISKAEEQIINFAKEHGISATLGHGKVIEYLQRYKPEHYSALVKSGVVRE